MIKLIPGAFHGVLDYLVAITLIAGPLVLGFQGLALFLAVAGGVGLILYSLITDYSTSARRLIPFPVHLFFDFVAALVLIGVAVWQGFEGLEQLFYIGIGAAVIVVVLLTNPNTSVDD